MSLVDNISDVAFASTYPVDKIVGVWEGTFNKSSDTTTRTGGAGSIKVFAIPHGYTRPVVVDLLWSDNGTTWADGGGSIGTNTSIAFSDSTNIYIVASSTTGTQHYKAIAVWMDEYDTSNPLVDSYISSTKDVLFDSRVNYQKINLEDETTYSPGTFGSSQTISVSHSLGYKPNAKAWFEPFSGEVWPLNSGGAANPFLYDFAQDEAIMEIYSDRIDVIVSRFSNATRKIWFKIYFDE